MRKWTARAGVLLGICALLGAAATAAPAPKSRSRWSSGEEDPFYKVGMSLYAAGNRDKALGCFRVALREHPGDAAVRAAVRRVETEIAAASSSATSRAAPEPSWYESASDAFDDLVLVQIPQVVNFDDTLGGGESVSGTLAAINGRIAQLLKEQRFAAEHDRPFRKQRELRSLIRRMPAVVA